MLELVVSTVLEPVIALPPHGVTTCIWEKAKDDA